MKPDPSTKNNSSELLQLMMDNPRRPWKNAGKDVKRHYRMTLMAGLVISLLSLTTLIRSDLRLNEEDMAFELASQEVVQIEEIEQTQQEEKPPPPPRPPVPVEVPNDVVMEDVELDLDSSLDLNDEMTDLPPPPPSPATVEDEEDDMEIFVVVEQMPQIIGGTQKVYEYLEYPEIARQAGVEGLVVVQLVVSPAGLPTFPEVVRSAGEILDKAAVNAVMRLEFVPGKQRGKPVSVRLAIPIRFRLRDTK